MTLKAVTLLCLMIKDRLTSSAISQDQLPHKAVPAGWAEVIQGRSQHSGACIKTDTETLSLKLHQQQIKVLNNMAALHKSNKQPACSC